MAMIDIEYRHSTEPDCSKEIRRKNINEMKMYLSDIVAEMQMADLSAKFVDTEYDGPNTVVINGKSIDDILKGVKIVPLESEDHCDIGTISLVKVARPPMEWNSAIIEDIPETILKNAIAKVFADINKNRII